ncbi:MAG: cytochrome P460 family protein [bacterium]|nr:cytochrome P460 family protein [bacterium]
MNPKTAFLCVAVALVFNNCRTEPRRGPAASLPVAAPAAVTHPETGIALPPNYRETFTNYLSLDRVQNHDQIIRLFANDIAMQGPNERNELPFGSVIVAEVYKARVDGEGDIEVSSLGRRIRGPMALLAVMERGEHLGKGYREGLRNGHWDFAAFTPGGEIAGKDLNSCRACHSPLQATDHLFSLDHLSRK